MPANIYWFRKALRLHDNPALVYLIKKNKNIIPIFCLDPWFTINARVGVRRWHFLLQSLADLDESLRKLGNRLYVFRGKPEEIFPILYKEYHVDTLAFEKDTERYAKVRDIEIINQARDYHVAVQSETSHTLYDPVLVISKNKGQVPLSYQSFLRVTGSLKNHPPKPVETPTNMPPPPSQLSDNHSDLYHPIRKNSSIYKYSGPNENFDVPTLAELRQTLPEKHSDHIGGETFALNRLEAALSDDNYVTTFAKPETSPAAIDPPSTTVLSPYLKFGCLSCRVFWWRIQEILSRSKTYTKPPTSLHGQLMWREFFYTCNYGIENFGSMEKNPICLQTEWKCKEPPPFQFGGYGEGGAAPSVAPDGARPSSQTPDEGSAHQLALYKAGKTGFPWIDAIMRQLRYEGWIHHLARHSVACFLTRGDLYIHWERGVEIFDEYLIDADESINTGNWLWLSASAFFHQYFRVYGPVSFPKKYDYAPYIRKYCPELANLPDKYLLEPWKASTLVQQAAHCILGQDYPHRMVIHEDVSKECIAKMKEAYTSREKHSQVGANPFYKELEQIRIDAHAYGDTQPVDEHEDIVFDMIPSSPMSPVSSLRQRPPLSPNVGSSSSMLSASPKSPLKSKPKPLPVTSPSESPNKPSSSQNNGVSPLVLASTTATRSPSGKGKGKKRDMPTDPDDLVHKVAKKSDTKDI